MTRPTPTRRSLWPGAAVLFALIFRGTAAPAAPPVRGDATIETLSALLDLEKRARTDQIDELTRATSELARAETGAARLRDRLVDSLRDGLPDSEAIGEAEESISDAEGRVRALEDRRRLLARRLQDSNRRISLLSEEIARRRARGRTNDPLSGRWDVTINAGSRKGVFRLALDGTLVSGDYVLDGGFRGSLRGTYVAEKVTLQRIDAERGFDATFYGRLNTVQKSIAGTWEATNIAPATGPTAGTWSATVAVERAERDDGGSERQ